MVYIEAAIWGNIMYYGNRHILIHDLANFDAFASAIRQLTGGSISPTLPEVTTKSLRELISRHPLISPIEISQAFNLHTADEVKQFIQPLIDSGEITVKEVPHGLLPLPFPVGGDFQFPVGGDFQFPVGGDFQFIEKNNKEENEDII